MTESLQLKQAYAECKLIAKREAKNFYYSFVALPEERRNAICAIYAFMRKADDLSDNEEISIGERREQLQNWLAEWRNAYDGEKTSDLVFIAVRDAMSRFNIPLSLLDELVDGVTMDLNRASDNSADTYATFSDLHRYCYLVASVVGLVCIRIFGYKDVAAEKLAEDTGIAFQLTNILRDVAEDTARNRVYLPLEDLAKRNVSLESLLHRNPEAAPKENEKALLADIGNRAENYYASAYKLLPLISPESRPALWVLVTIYHSLLKRIRQRQYNVFTQRVSVPTVQKIGILIVGMARMTWARLFA